LKLVGLLLWVVSASYGDLLAEPAAILLSAHEGELDEPQGKAAAELCRVAAADEALIRGGGKAPG